MHTKNNNLPSWSVGLWEGDEVGGEIDGDFEGALVERVVVGAIVGAKVGNFVGNEVVGLTAQKKTLLLFSKTQKTFLTRVHSLVLKNQCVRNYFFK